MVVPGFRHFLGSALSVLGVFPAWAEDPALCGGKPSPVKIAAALDGVSLKLTDGRTLRLAHVIVPLPIDGDEEAVLRAKETLAKIANGKDASLFLSSGSKDRYGRISAMAVVIEGKTWLEAELLVRGAARVYPPADDNCAKALLQFEAKARSARAGLWNETKFGVFDAKNVDALLAAEGRFVVVEGRIRRVGAARGRIYLDFGRRFTEDFTIVVPDNLRKILLEKGSDPKSWRGKRVRVRGVLFSWGGPAIEVNQMQAIELLDRDIPKSE